MIRMPYEQKDVSASLTRILFPIIITVIAGADRAQGGCR